MDAFFAAVEQRDTPELRGKPVVIGGNPNSRSVVSTASYEARKFGVKSAMPSATAKKLCPQAIFVRPNFEKYSEASRIVFSILRQHSVLVEPVSIDEAYLDVTEHKLKIEDPVTIAKLIKQNIFAVTKLTASAGVAPNMFLAKIASDFNKPNGLTVIRPEEVKEFLIDLPVRKIPGVGPVTEKELHQLKLFTCGDLLKAGPVKLSQALGKYGAALHDRAKGIDDRAVEPHGESKQSSAEETYDDDLLDMQEMKKKLKVLSYEVFQGLHDEGRMGKTIVLKVKYFDFEQITRSQTLTRKPENAEEVYQAVIALLTKKTMAGKKPIRLLGVGISGLLPKISEDVPAQMDLFGEKIV